MRTLKTTATAAALLGASLLLSGCTGQPGPTKDQAGAACASPGDASKKITVEGKFGKETKIGGVPVEASAVERSVIESKADTPVKKGATVFASISLFNGRTGALIDHQSGQPLVNDPARIADGWGAELVRCAAEGQRMVLAMPAESAFGGAPSKLGITGVGDKDSVVIVADVTSIGAAQK